MVDNNIIDKGTFANCKTFKYRDISLKFLSVALEPLTNKH